MTLLRHGVGLLILCWLVVLPSLASIRMVDASGVVLPMAAGAEAELTFELHNDADVADSIRFALVRSDQGAQSYLLTDLSACPQSNLVFPGYVGLLPRQTIQCRYRLQRPALMRSDASFGFLLLEPAGSSQSKVYQVGDLTRLAVSYRWLRFAAPGQSPRVQVTVYNEGPTGLATVAYAGCAQLGLKSPARVVAGDCVNSGTICFLGSVEQGFQIPDIAAGASKSCVLEWAATSTLAGFELGLTGLVKPQGGALLNTNPAAQRIQVSGVPAAPVPVPLPSGHSAALLSLVALVIVGACTAIRGRGYLKER